MIGMGCISVMLVDKSLLWNRMIMSEQDGYENEYVRGETTNIDVLQQTLRVRSAR